MAVERSAGVQAHVLDICQNTYSDFYAELFSSRIIKGYLEGFESGEIKADFQAYIKGIIRNKIYENAEKVGIISQRWLSEKEIFDRLVDSKKPDTKKQLIGLAKARFADQVRSHLLAEYPEPISNVVDYFFEQFCEQRYSAIRNQITGKGEVVKQLLSQFSRVDYEKGLNYRATVPPMPEAEVQQVLLPQTEDEELSEEELLSLLAVKGCPEAADGVNLEELRAERDVWWDQLLNGREPQQEDMDEQARLMNTVKDRKEREALTLCLSCANLMRNGTDAVKRNLRIFLLHNFSHTGSRRERPEHLSGDRLHLADIEGLCLTWDEASKLLGVNPDYSAHARIKEKIQQEFIDTWQSIYREPYMEAK